MRRRGVFVTGSDTGVGKTWVTSRLAAHWSGVGHRVAALKAAESGCRRSEGLLIGDDDEALVAAVGGWQPERCLYKFEPAVAPGVAADDLGVSIDFVLIGGQVDRLADLADVVLVEGAGGWLVPMGGGRTIQGLAEALDLPVLVVSRAGLGTINHTLLTLQAIRAAGCTPIAVAVSLRAEDDRELAARNLREIDRLAGVPVVMVEQDVAALAAILGPRLGLSHR